LAENIKAVLTEFGTRLAITEHAVSQLIQDTYYADEAEEDCGCEDCDEKDEVVPGDTEGSEEARARHESMDTVVLDLDDPELDNTEAALLEAEALIRAAERANEG
jgi:hypothetical protein